MIRKLSSIVIILGTIIVFSGLLLLAYLGFYNRYWADDWCYSADARTLGTLPATMQFFKEIQTGYSTNRYSLTFISALTENTLGMFGNKLIATLTILLWLTGMVWTGYNISRLTKRIPFTTLLLTSSLLLFYNLYISPQRFQILYWRSGVLPYSTAIVFWFFILGLGTHQMLRDRPATWVHFIIAPLAFITAGLGEISCTLIMTGTSMLLIATWFYKRQKHAWAEKSFNTFLTAWLFLLIGMITLIVSPSNFRVADIHANVNSPFAVPFDSASHAIDFILISLRTLPIPHAIFISVILGLAILSTQSGSNPVNIFKQLIIQLVITLLITYLLIVVIQAPTAYFYSSYPDPRGQSLSRFILLTGLLIMAWFSGVWVSEKFKRNWVLWVSLTALLIGFAYTARSIQNIYGDLPGFIHRAQVWDARDRIIKEAKANGIMLVEVPAIDVAEIHTQDMFRSKSKAWNEYTVSCASRYYGVDGLKATVGQ
jgi:hypothetical protein